MARAPTHQPVLADAVVAGLQAQPGRHFIDGTLGNGGHAWAILAATAPDGKVLGIDADADAIRRVQQRLHQDPALQSRLVLVHGHFQNIQAIAERHGFVPTGGVLFDLGVSSPQLDDPAAGFGFDAGTLDMRFDKTGGRLTAAELLERMPAGELERALREFGEEPLARPIAEAMVKNRREGSIATGADLSALVAAVYGKHYRRRSRRHPATRVFQALRIAVNGELENLRRGLKSALEAMPAGARLAVISYHSLEDRIVKNFFRDEARGCLCPPQLPACVCHHQPALQKVTAKPIRPSTREVAQNSRSRSAKLRIAVRLAATATQTT